MTLSTDPDDFCFIDTETRSFDDTPPEYASVTDCGAYKYRHHAHVIVLTYAIGNAPVQRVALDTGFDQPMYWKQLPLDLRQFTNKVNAGKGWFVAWNAGFDRLMTNAQDGWIATPVDGWVDAMAQAVASNLPPSLAGASKFAGLEGKVEEGKELIRLFCSPGGATPQTHPDEWERFKHYATVDTQELRAIWQATRPLSRAEWEVYWANEEINDRGIAIDQPFIRAAARIADVDRERTNEKLAEITCGKVTKVTQVKRLVDWTYDMAPHAAVRELMVKSWRDPDEADEREPESLGLARERIEAILAFYDALEEKQDGLDDVDIRIADALDLRLWGGSATPGKFGKMLTMADGGRLRGQYVFNGAAQTLRFSSRGVQVHNLTRSTLGEKEADAIELIASLED